jgi:hypothetical protein
VLLCLIESVAGQAGDASLQVPQSLVAIPNPALALSCRQVGSAHNEAQQLVDGMISGVASLYSRITKKKEWRTDLAPKEEGVKVERCSNLIWIEVKGRKCVRILSGEMVRW